MDLIKKWKCPDCSIIVNTVSIHLSLYAQDICKLHTMYQQVDAMHIITVRQELNYSRSYT
jgi:hypothetical protein